MTTPASPDSSAALQKLGWLLLVAGTIIGSVGGARLPEADWLVSGVGIALVFAGAVVLFLVRRHTGKVTGDSPELLVMLRALPAELDALVHDAPDLSLADIATRISDLDRSRLRPIADGAPRMLSVLGTERYADVFGTYASGERSLARAWSAASDLHRPETLAALELGTARIRDAISRLDG